MVGPRHVNPLRPTLPQPFSALREGKHPVEKLLGSQILTAQQQQDGTGKGLRSSQKTLLKRQLC